jgi:hypothetical protein
VAKGRVGGERLQQRQVAAQPVEGADRGFGVGHADVDVQGGNRGRHGISQQVVDALVAGPVGDRCITLAGRGMRARPEQAGTGAEHGLAQAAEQADRLGGVAAHVGDELDLAGMQLALNGPLHRAEALLHRLRRVHLASCQRIDQEQLLLDAQRERHA